LGKEFKCMFCLLSEAYPGKISSCWQNDSCNSFGSEPKITKSIEENKPSLNSNSNAEVPMVRGALVQGQCPMSPSGLREEGPIGPISQDMPCFSFFEHCIACPRCRRMLQLYFQQEPRNDDEYFQRPRRSSSRRRSRRRYFSSSQREGGGGVGASILSEPIGNIKVTWGTLLLVLLGVSTFLILCRAVFNK
jgi:hypothetical protein